MNKIADKQSLFIKKICWIRPVLKLFYWVFFLSTPCDFCSHYKGTLGGFDDHIVLIKKCAEQKLIMFIQI